MTVLHLLVVEDDSELRSLLVRGLSKEGFDVQAVGDAAAAMARARDVPDALWSSTSAFQMRALAS
jgi:DNA-binding response OmpR family regulator